MSSGRRGGRTRGTMAGGGRIRYGRAVFRVADIYEQNASQDTTTRVDEEELLLPSLPRARV